LPLDGLQRSAQRDPPCCFQADSPSDSSNKIASESRSSGYACGPLAPAHGLECGRQQIGPQRQFELRRAGETAERVGLIGPVQPAGAGRVMVQMMFARLVVGDHPREAVGIKAVEFHVALVGRDWQE
jgi:hypothetical protein